MPNKAFQESIKNNITELTPSLFKIIENYELVGIGETPHRVNEYYPTIIKTIQTLMTNQDKVLLLLEKGWWLNTTFERYVQDNDQEFLDIIQNDPKSTKGQVAFYKELSLLGRKYPKMLDCSLIDIFTHQEHEHFQDIARTTSENKFEKSNRAFEALKKGDCLEREDFLFNEAITKIKNNSYSKIILFFGGMHVRTCGGTPNGADFVESLFSRLKKEFSYSSGNFTFLALSGSNGVLKRQNGEIISLPQKLPELDSDMETFKNILKETPQTFSLIKSSDIATSQDMNKDFLEWLESYNYIISCQEVTPDL